MRTIHIAYIKPKTFSGQSAATSLIVKGLINKGFLFTELPMFALDRSASRIISLLAWIRSSGSILPGLKNLYFEHKPILYINLGQGYASFLRVLWWFIPLIILKPSLKIIISLHGHTFMKWEKTDIETRLFLYLLKKAQIITVLGPKQKDRLLILGLSENKIRIVSNTCELETINEDLLKIKHKLSEGDPIRVLHLSLLIESKGFPEYLDALEILSKQQLSRPIEAVLCGPMSFTQYCRKLRTPELKSAWIKNKIDTINSSSLGQVKIEWIPGAKGTSKEELFNDAHIFVLPTYFPVEAQPLVLLEALSKGCTVITSTAGEITSTINPDCALILEDLSSENIACNILLVLNDDKRRTEMALNGLTLVSGPLSLDTYSKTWENIFNEFKF